MKKNVKKVAVALTAVAISMLLLSCGSTKLYSWYDYQEDYYHYVKNNDKDSLDDLFKTYDKIINKQKETRGIVPPGIYGDYGYALIEAGKVEEGKAMLAKEVELYPESAVFVESILKRVK